MSVDTLSLDTLSLDLYFKLSPLSSSSPFLLLFSDSVIITIMRKVIKISMIIMLVTMILIIITVLGSVVYHTQNLHEKQYFS